MSFGALLYRWYYQRLWRWSHRRKSSHYWSFRDMFSFRDWHKSVQLPYKDGSRKHIQYIIFLFIFDDSFHIHKLDEDYWAHCRWSTLSGEPILYVKYDRYQPNIIDTEKRVLILKRSENKEAGMLKIYETKFFSHMSLIYHSMLICFL